MNEQVKVGDACSNNTILLFVGFIFCFGLISFIFGMSVGRQNAVNDMLAFEMQQQNEKRKRELDNEQFQSYIQHRLALEVQQHQSKEGK